MSSNIRINRICSYCNQIFVAKTFTTKYCSHTCNQRDYNKKVKEEKLRQSKEEFSTQSKVSKLKKTTAPFDKEQLKAKSYLSISKVCVLLNMYEFTLFLFQDIFDDDFSQYLFLGNNNLISTVNSCSGNTTNYTITNNSNGYSSEIKQGASSLYKFEYTCQ